MEATAGTILASAILVLTSLHGYRKYEKPILWLGFVPVFSILHTYLGWYFLALGFRHLDHPEEVPLNAWLLAPTYVGVRL